MTTLISTPLQFTRRVSFNNLQPQQEDDIHTNLKPIYNLTSAPPTVTVLPPVQFNTSVFDPNYTSKPFTPTVSRRKRLKLPQPPGKSILKNKLTPEQIASNLTSIQFEDEQIDKDVDFMDDNIELTTGKESGRRKSFAGMSDEELMALDPQFQTTKSRTSSIDQFKFDNQKTYYLSAPKRSGSSVPTPNTTYPTSNENNYKAINLTVKHNDYDEFQYNRTLLTVISGRRHTWNSVDWLFSINQTLESASFLQNGDYLIISSLIPQKFIQSFNPKKLDEYLYKKCETLLTYLLSNQNLLLVNDLKIKLTIEFVLDNTDDVHKSGYKYVINHLCNQYQPNLLIIGTKSSNFNFKYPTQIKNANKKNEYLVKLSSYIIKYSPVPVVLVGQGTKFHNYAQIEKKRRSSSLKFEPEPIRGRRRSNSSSISSTNSLDSVEMFAGKQEMASITSNLSEKVDQIFDSADDNKFAALIGLISDNSTNAAKNYFIAVGSKDDSLKVDPKIHSIYRSQSQAQSNGLNIYRTNSRESDHKVYKVKSLLGGDEREKKDPKDSKLFKVVSTSETPSQMRKRQASVASGGSISGPNGTPSSSDTSKSVSRNNSRTEEKPTEKKRGSIWKKLGLKK